MSNPGHNKLCTRRRAFSLLGGSGAALLLSHCKTVPASRSASAVLRPPRLPWSTVFKGEAKFRQLCETAKRKNWAALPIGERTHAFGLALCGTPYVNYTLEIHDRIESPSVNFEGMDCWTFYEVSLAMARLIKNPSSAWTREALLYYIELERYRNGRCDVTYVSRMHHLEEVFADNQRRGLGTNVTASLGGYRLRRQVKYMSTSTAIRNSRYLRNDTSMVPEMARIEAQISTLPVYYIPNSRVAGIESKLQNGDVLAIVSNWHSSYTSHVGLAKREGSTCRLMHASSSRSKGRQCLVDARVSQYLSEKRTNMGLIVFRPGEAPLIA
ncbi:MAG: N-acetylmuramoyl-L-alanine amidase-like domain-containing protein [Verrucomicrobiota bacterium]